MTSLRAQFFLLLALFVLLVGPASNAKAQPEKPNILFIMVDDLGKEWISAYGAEKIETPNVDRLAETGMRFENAYSMPQCTPTRVTLLTGQYPYRHGWTNHFDVPRWGSGAHFDPARNASFARVLREAGYARAVAGKWQIDDFRVEPYALDEAGVAMPFIVSGPTMVSEGRVTDALTDLSDILPTFAELAGTAPSSEWSVDGVSIAPLLLGASEDTPRNWIYAQGGNPAAFERGRCVSVNRPYHRGQGYVPYTTGATGA